MKWIKRIGFPLLGIFLLLNIIAISQAYQFTHFYPNIPPAKKPDQMNFGEKASAIFFGVHYPKSVVVDSFQVPHESFTIKASDDISLECWYAKAEKIAKGTVIMFHGHASSKSGIIKEAEAFHQLGWNVLMTDFRAHGNSEGTVCTIGFEEAKDVKAAYDYIEVKGEKNIVLWGISLGASTILKSVADYNNIKPNKVILEMPFGSLTDAVKGKLRTMHLPEQPFSTLLTLWGGAEQGFWAFDMNPEEYAAKLNCPVLLQWGINDQRVTETETNTIYKNLASHDKLMIKYAHSAHESLYKKEPEKWLATVGGFLNK